MMNILLLAAAIVETNFAPTTCDSWLKEYYGRLSFDDYALVSRAARTLEANSNGKSLENIYSTAPYPWKPLRGIMPSPAHFVGVWNWDSAFHAMGVSRWDADYAVDQLKLFTDFMQLDNGMYIDCIREGNDAVAHLKIEEYASDHFQKVTDCSKPPVVGWAAWQCDQRKPFDRKFLIKFYNSLKRNELWWRTNRLDAKSGLFHYDGNCEELAKRKVAAGWESGMDDSPRWDGNAWNYLAVDLNSYLALTYRALKYFAGRVGDKAAAEEYAKRGAELEKRIEELLWDDEAGAYYDRNRTTGKFSRILTPVSYLPLFIGTASPERAAKMIAKAKRLSPGWPSVAYDEPKFEPMGYWRGRTWLNVAYMALKGIRWYGEKELSDLGKKTILSWVANDPGVIYENYNPLSGLPAGAVHFGWSSTFILSFVLDWDTPRNKELPCN